MQLKDRPFIEVLGELLHDLQIPLDMVGGVQLGRAAESLRELYRRMDNMHGYPSPEKVTQDITRILRKEIMV